MKHIANIVCSILVIGMVSTSLAKTHEVFAEPAQQENIEISYINITYSGHQINSGVVHVFPGQVLDLHIVFNYYGGMITDYPSTKLTVNSQPQLIEVYENNFYPVPNNNNQAQADAQIKISESTSLNQVITADFIIKGNDINSEENETITFIADTEVPGTSSSESTDSTIDSDSSGETTDSTLNSNSSDSYTDNSVSSTDSSSETTGSTPNSNSSDSYTDNSVSSTDSSSETTGSTLNSNSSDSSIDNSVSSTDSSSETASSTINSSSSDSSIKNSTNNSSSFDSSAGSSNEISESSNLNSNSSDYPTEETNRSTNKILNNSTIPAAPNEQITQSKSNLPLTGEQDESLLAIVGSFIFLFGFSILMKNSNKAR